MRKSTYTRACSAMTLVMTAVVAIQSTNLTAQQVRAANDRSKDARDAPAKPGERFIPDDVDTAHPIYATNFDDMSVLKDWRLEGGQSQSVANGSLVLQSQRGTATQRSTNHLVSWLDREVPADFLLEFTVRPEHRDQGLNIVFFCARGLNGESVLDPARKPRDGTFKQYHSGDLNGYHISYWAAGRETANLRKNKGFHLVAEGKDLVHKAPADTFQTIRVYKRGAKIRLMVDDVVAVAWDDDGKTYGPVLGSGWIGLRQMGHSERCEYGHVKVYALKSAQAPSSQKAAHLPPADERWAADGPRGIPSFSRHVQPLLTRMGCNARECHGSFQGQGGFRLSLWGSDSKLDFEGLEPRIDVLDPGNSLALLKPTRTVAHKGGRRFEIDSWQYRLLSSWIAARAPVDASGPYGAAAKGDAKDSAALTGLDVIPAEVVLANKGDQTQLQVVARYHDGSSEDVTCLTQFSSNDAFIADVTASGLITAGNPGGAAVVANYGAVVHTAQVVVPFPSEGSIDFPVYNKIDELVLARWKKLGLQPSAPADDSEFLRRLSLDLIGTLPTADEVRRFLADQDPHKRSKKIDELLQRPEYALYWATYFSDLTGNIGGPDPKGEGIVAHRTASMWHDWLREKLQNNLPYDELAAGFVTATTREGRSAKESVEEHKQIMSAVEQRADANPPYAKRKTNDIFWKSRTPDEAALRLSYAFMGLNLACAQCHKHPFDRWTQDDFKGYTAFFTPVTTGVPDDVPKNEVPTGPAKRGEAKAGLLYYSEVYIETERKAQQAEDDLQQPATPKVPGGAEYPVEAGKDPRIHLMDWMREPQNRYFARALVNRFWAHYFGAGLVNPTDDLNAANPPTNPELLDWLAQEFIAPSQPSPVEGEGGVRGFDLKHLHRLILNSRVYQLSWRPAGNNAGDTLNFSHARLRRMPAEVLLDAIDQVTGTQTDFTTVPGGFGLGKASGRSLAMAPPGTRAIGLASSYFAKKPVSVLGSAGAGYTLAIFGRPARTEACDCERTQEPTLTQALYLISDVDVHNKLTAKTGRLTNLLEQMPDNERLIEELYLSTVSRYPTAVELQRSLDYVSGTADRRVAFEDLLWALINVREFVFIH